MDVRCARRFLAGPAENALSGMWTIIVSFALMFASSPLAAQVVHPAPETMAPTAAGSVGAPLGIANHRPVLGAACRACPWGAMAEIVKAAMRPYGYDVQICYNCSLPEAPRLVAAAELPPAWKHSDNPNFPDYLVPPPPAGRVDFGTAAALRVWQAYAGTHDYAGEPAHRNLRLIANFQNPNFLVVAVKASSGVTDLSQLRGSGRPLRILAQSSPEAKAVLARYGLTPEAVEAAGGSITQDRSKDFDLIVWNAGMGYAPEYNVWQQVSQRYDLRFIQLPDDLLRRIAADNELDFGTVPFWLFRGVDQPIRTVVQTGNAIYLRDDAPDDFAYLVAKALDEQQDILQWSHLAFYYDVHKVWQDRGLPLHSGAARYYRERGYMK